LDTAILKLRTDVSTALAATFWDTIQEVAKVAVKHFKSEFPVKHVATIDAFAKVPGVQSKIL
jgi:hypothetical protein